MGVIVLFPLIRILQYLLPTYYLRLLVIFERFLLDCFRLTL